MASVGKEKDGKKRILFVAPDGKRKTIRLGKCSVRDADSFKIRVENLLSALIQGREPNRDDAEWLSRISSGLREKLARAGLIQLSKEEIIPTISEWIESYIEKRIDIKSRTKDILRISYKTLFEFYDKNKAITEFTEYDAMKFRLYMIDKGLSEATVRSRCRKIKQFFNAARKKGFIQSNPFDNVPTADRTNKQRQFYVSKEMIQKVIDACPNAQWRLIFALARYAGLRIPSELFGLTWDNIHWDKQRFIVYSPKTEHIEGKETRTVPLFPELEPYFIDVYELAEQGQNKVITIYDERNSNLRTQAHRIIKKAGLEPWPRTFHNLRASCETDLVEILPVHVVTSFIGNTPEIARKHYLQVTEKHFEIAVKKTAQNPAQQMHETTRNYSQDGKLIEALKTLSPDIYESLREFANSCNIKTLRQTPRVGFEPTT